MPKSSKLAQSGRSTTFIMIAALIGLLDAGYLTYIHFANVPIYCTPGLGQCDVVNSSRWSHLWGIPIALFGVIGYLLIFLIATFGKKSKIIEPYVNILLFGLSFGGFLFSMYLTSLELFVIKAICQWCVLSALLMTSIFITSIVRLVVQSRMSISSGGNEDAKN